MSRIAIAILIEKLWCGCTQFQLTVHDLFSVVRSETNKETKGEREMSRLLMHLS